MDLPDSILELIETVATFIDYVIPYPFNEELIGLAKALDIGLGDVVLSNMIYDLTA